MQDGVESQPGSSLDVLGYIIYKETGVGMKLVSFQSPKVDFILGFVGSQLITQHQVVIKDPQLWPCGVDVVVVQFIGI